MSRYPGCPARSHSRTSLVCCLPTSGCSIPGASVQTFARVSSRLVHKDCPLSTTPSPDFPTPVSPSSTTFAFTYRREPGHPRQRAQRRVVEPVAVDPTSLEVPDCDQRLPRMERQDLVLPGKLRDPRPVPAPPDLADAATG